MYKHFRGLKLSFFASFSVQFLLSTWTMKHPEGQTLEDRGLILED